MWLFRAWKSSIGGAGQESGQCLFPPLPEHGVFEGVHLVVPATEPDENGRVVELRMGNALDKRDYRIGLTSSSQTLPFVFASTHALARRANEGAYRCSANRVCAKSKIYDFGHTLWIDELFFVLLLRLPRCFRDLMLCGLRRSAIRSRLRTSSA